MSNSSKIFSGFRALGFVTNEIPFAMFYNQKQNVNYLVASVGKAFHFYNCPKLRLIAVSDSHEEPITCVAASQDFTFSASGHNIFAFIRGKRVKQYEGHQHDVKLLLPFHKHLLSVDVQGHLKIWDVASQEIYLELHFSNDTFEITALLNPTTYVNKILLGSSQGSLQLWNIRKGQQLYVFEGWNSAVTCLVQAPAVDVAAIGLANGRVILHNLKYDETVMSFCQDWGAVTTVSFRTDGHPVMATASELGHIALWNLEEKRLQSQIREAHNGPVTGMACLPSQPLMVTSSPDNSLKVWIFDMPDGGGRMMHSRASHSEPPNRVHFHGNDGQTILSAGQDSKLLSFSTVNDSLNKSLGRASFNKKMTKRTGLKADTHCMPPIEEFASEINRQSDWDGIAAVHRGLREVTTWNYNKHTMGQHRLQHERFRDKKYQHTSAQAVTITSCGNFVLVAYSSGHVDMFNIQSGIHRGSYGSPTAHAGSVRGVATDSLNQVTITGGADNLVKFWKFKTKELLETVEVKAQVSRIVMHRESSMLAVSLDDFSVLIFDVDTRRIIRQFTGHRNTVADMTFSPDARWLITSSMDSCIRTWDLPSGCLIDCYMVESPVTSLSMSPTGEFLVSTHVDDLGLYLWSNKTLYIHVALRPLPAEYQPLMMNLPSSSHLSAGLREDKEDEEDFQSAEFKSVDQISEDFITLANLPHTRWQNLLNLDIIKQRNKPKQPPKAPKAAPFFLPTVAGLEPKFAVPEQKAKQDDASHILTKQLQPVTEFGKVLSKCSENSKYKDALEMMKSYGASAVDLELRCLAPDGGGSIQLMLAFVHFISYVLQTNRDFELAQAWLALFLKLHGDLIASEQQLMDEIRDLQMLQDKAWHKLQEMYCQTLCLINYLKSATL